MLFALVGLRLGGLASVGLGSLAWLELLVLIGCMAALVGLVGSVNMVWVGGGGLANREKKKRATGHKKHKLPKKPSNR